MGFFRYWHCNSVAPHSPAPLRKFAFLHVCASGAIYIHAHGDQELDDSRESFKASLHPDVIGRLPRPQHVNRKGRIVGTEGHTDAA